MLVALSLLWQLYCISRRRFAKSLMTCFFDTDAALDVSNHKVMPCRNTVSRAVLGHCLPACNDHEP
jgi:hypothetical protein